MDSQPAAEPWQAFRETPSRTRRGSARRASDQRVPCDERGRRVSHALGRAFALHVEAAPDALTSRFHRGDW
jgi:hypothetical protein